MEEKKTPTEDKHATKTWPHRKHYQVKEAKAHYERFTERTRTRKHRNTIANTLKARVRVPKNISHTFCGGGDEHSATLTQGSQSAQTGVGNTPLQT